MVAETSMIQWASHRLVFGSRTCVMGILNVTPDSFSDGGRYFFRGFRRCQKASNSYGTAPTFWTWEESPAALFQILFPLRKNRSGWRR